MRNPQRNLPRSRSASTSAPYGGLNVRDPINAMPNSDAISLVNWIPQQFGVRCRKGWAEHAINLGAPVRTLASYSPDREDLVNSKLFAFTDAAIYDITNSTNAPSVSTALPGSDNYGYFSVTSFANSAGTFLVGCSHQGGYRYYNGTSWVTPTFGTGAGQVGGVNPSNLAFVVAWKRRLFFVEKNSARVWYLPTDSVTGTASLLDVGPFMSDGGKVSFITDWTIDAGEGIDDFLIVAGESGQILVYKGTNPDSASSFGLVGVYDVGALPVGRRAFTKLGGDVLIMSELGIQPISYVTRGGQSLLRAGSVDYLGKVQPLFAELVSKFSLSVGWAMLFIPKESLMLVTIPPGAADVRQQYALYTGTNAWTSFENMPMNGSMLVWNNRFYFGTDTGEVCVGFEGFFDGVEYGTDTGTGIVGKIQPVYNYFGAVGKNKHFQMVRPTFIATDQPLVVATMETDYKYQTPVGTPITTPNSNTLWDVSNWDEANWAGTLNTYSDWLSVENVGYAGSLVIDTTCTGDTFLGSIDYVYEYGGIL